MRIRYVFKELSNKRKRGAKVADINKRLETIDKSLDEIDKRLDAIEEEIDKEARK